MISPSEISRVADGLSKAAGAAILRGEPDGKLGLVFVRWWHANGDTLRSLIKSDLGTRVWSGVVLNELGLAVRAHLESQHG